MAAQGKELDAAVLQILQNHPNGISDETLEQQLPNVDQQRRVESINRLLQSHRLQLFTGPNKKVFYKAVTADEAAKYKGLSTEDIMLYQLIKQAGSAGLWTKDMRVRSNLAQPVITKILKTLEGRGMVKSVKNVNNPSRKVYMLSELEPSRELTGGAWYTENQFDSEFIDVLREACYKFIEFKKDTKLVDIANFIRTKGFSKVELRNEDIMSIIQTLIYDGRVDQVDGDNDDDLDDHFRPATWGIPEQTAFTSVPCGVCPVLHECRDDGVISPKTCIYYTKWLEF